MKRVTIQIRSRLYDVLLKRSRENESSLSAQIARLLENSMIDELRLYEAHRYDDDVVELRAGKRKG